ncbi:hypothetical protein KR222_009928 [Zaprionus bogoriensis]|nr:hypothetical protein KR222_009928 [Zaprionus bogoriensis]
MCKSVSVSLAILLALCVLATASMSMEKKRSQHYCSTSLNEILSQLCGDKGFNRMIQKRGSSLMDLDPLDPIQYIEEKESPVNSAELLSYPMQGGRLRNLFQENAMSSLTATRRRTRQGIVDECCSRRCTFNELFNYCAA